MSKVDKRVVQMKFDNKQFESGIKKTLSSLKNLNKKLKMKNAGKGMDDLQKKANKFSLKGILTGVESLNDKFSALGIVGITALQNITNSAIEAGKKIVSALTLDPIISGFEEYELKMNAIQTIRAGTGRSLEDVNASLDRMNEYSDKTIYSFADMTSNVGKFTNAGIKLEDAENAMMGITNWAALSGAGTQEASMAMYNLSQAMSMGKLTVMDYKSIENANMATQQFKQHMIDTAVEVGTLQDLGNGMYQDMQNGGDAFDLNGFRNELNSGWASTEVMTKALLGFNDETTELGQKALAAATEIKTVTLLMDTMKEAVQSGWTTSWEMIIGDQDQATELLTEVGQAFETMIKPGIEARNTMLEFWNTTGGRDDVIQGLKNVFKGLFDILGPIKEAFREIFPPMTGKRLVEISANFKELTEKFKIGETTSKNLKRTFKGLFAILKIGKSLISALVKGFFGIVKAILPVGDGILAVTGGLGDFFVGLSNTIDKGNIFENVIGGIVKGLSFFIKKIAVALKSILTFSGEGITNVVGNLGIAKDKIAEFFNGLDFSGAGKVFEGLGAGISTAIDYIGKGFKKIGEWIGNLFGPDLFGKTVTVAKIGLFASLIKAITGFIKKLKKAVPDIGEKFGDILDGVTETLEGVRDTVKSYQTQLRAKTLMQIAAAIAILTAAIIALSMIDGEKLKKALGAMTVVLGELLGALFIIQKISSGGKGLSGLAVVLVGVGIALTIMASAVKKLSEIPFTSMVKGLGGVMVLLTGMSVFLNRTKMGPKAITASIGLIALGLGLRIMSGAVKSMGEVDGDQIAKGLLAIGVSIGLMIQFINALDNKSIMQSALAFTVLAISLNIIVRAVKKMSEIDFGKAAKGLLVIAVALGVISTALNTLPKDAKAKAKSLLVLATSMVILGHAISQLSQLKWMEIAKGVGTMTAALMILVVAMNSMQANIAGAFAMVIMAGALTLLTVPMLIFGNMDLSTIAKGLLTLAGVFAVIGVAGLILGPLVPILMGLGVGIGLIGAGTALAGVGLMAFATGLAALTVAGAPAIAMLVLFIKKLFELAIEGAKAAGKFIVEFLKAIGSKMGEIVKAGVDIVVNFVKGLISGMGKLIKIGSEFLVKLLKGIASKIGDIVKAGMELLIEFIKGITSKIGDLVEAGVDLLVAFLKGVASKIGDIIQAGVEVILSFVEGMATAITNNTGRMTTAIGNLMKAIGRAALEVLGTFLGGFLEVGGKLIGKLITGVKNKKADLKRKVNELGNAMKTKFESFKSKLKTAAKNVVGGFISGMGSKLQAIKDKASELGSKAYRAIKDKLQIKSPSRVFAEVGRFTAQGFIVGLDKLISKVEKKGADVGGAAYDGIKDTLDKLPDDPEFNPTITPVLDMGDAEKDLDRVFSEKRGLEVEGTRGRVRRVANSGQGQHGNSSYSSTDNSEVNNYYTVHATIREEQDIKKVSRELYKLQEQGRRGRPQ